MKIIKYNLLIIGLLFVFTFKVKAQIDKTFWFAIPELSPQDGWNTNDNSYLRIITFGQPTTVTISQPGAVDGFFKVLPLIAANSSISVSFTADEFKKLVCDGFDIIVSKGLYISSNEPIAVYFDSGVGNVNPDLFVLKGLNGLGNNFIITSGNFKTTYRTRHEAYIIASENNTVINITPSVAIEGHPAAIPYEVTLNKGQVYILSSHYTMGAYPTITENQKLSGTLINSNRPISVVHADDLIEVPNGGCGDLNGDQLVPTNLAGVEYLLMPGSLTSGASDYIFIYPIKNGVTIKVNGSPVAGVFNLGQFYRINNNGTSKYITTSDSVLVYQISGTGCEVGGSVIPSLACTGSQKVSIVRNNTLDFKISILVKTEDINNFTFRNATGIIEGVISASLFASVGSSGWSAASIDLNINDPILNGQSAIISNSSGLFHLGVISNTGGGTSFGYFSNFVNLPNQFLGPDLEICGDQQVRLEPNITFTNFVWQDGSTNPFFIADKTGVYYAKIGVGTCQRIDSVQLLVNDLPRFELGNDTTICSGGQYELQITAPAGATYKWNTGSTTASINIVQAGSYIATSNLKGCIWKDTINIGFIDIPSQFLGEDREICTGEQVRLEPKITATNFMWQDGSTNPFFIADKTGVYYAKIGVGTCQRIDSVQLLVNDLPRFELGNDTTICSGGQYELQITAPASATYKWNTGQTTASINIVQAGSYIATSNLKGCIWKDTVHISIIPKIPVYLGTDSTICEGQKILLKANIVAEKYKWQDGSDGKQFLAQEAGLYYLEVTSGKCIFSDSINIMTKKCVYYQVYVPNIFTPNADNINDEFRAFVHPDLKVLSYNLRIFDRWGTFIFESRDIERGWDGLVKGNPAKTDTYVYSYTIEYEYENGIDRKSNGGTFQLLR